MTDFGISKEGLLAEDDRTATFCGTPEYLAPEVLQVGRLCSFCLLLPLFLLLVFAYALFRAPRTARPSTGGPSARSCTRCLPVRLHFSLCLYLSLCFSVLFRRTGLPPFYSTDVQQMYTKILTAPLVIPD
jgi:serine/threonine protein kinase